MDHELMTVLDLDALQPAKSIVLLALEHYESADLFQQLLSVNSALEALTESMHKLRAEQEYQQSRDVLTLVQKFEEIQKIVRDKFNLRARGLLRGVRTRLFPDRVPDELLLKIVNHFESSLDETTLSFDSNYGFAGNITTIKNIRLTCRRLCEISSHLLLPCVHVSPSLSSLEHLDQVARHPTISQGLRLFVVDVADLRLIAAQNFHRFSRSCFARLGEILEHYESECDGIYSRRRNYYIKKAERVYNILSPFMKSGLFASDLDDIDSLNEPELSLRFLLVQERARIQKLYTEQVDTLWSGRFTRAVAAAAARSRSRVYLHIRNIWKDEDDPDRFGVYEALYEDPNLDIDFQFVIRSTRMHVGQRWQTGGLDQTSKYPQSVLHELPLAICEAGATLTGFKIDISGPVRPPFPTLGITQDQISALGQASKNLEVLSFRINGSLGREGLSTYLSAVTNPHKIRILSLKLSFIKNFSVNPPSNPDAVGPLQLLDTWERLETLTLKNFSMHLDELRKLLAVLKPGVNMIFDGIRLLSGTWEEALDCIRSKASDDSELIGPSGAEVQARDFDYEGIFGDEFGYSAATQYIRSYYGIDNPFREDDEATEILGEP
ncbi:hypothetical protein F5883DRAFT_717056 [Diaporthe sp. PMI_573]|nr:hypothetical protein F5883DRAFT_717056 [Diaporthaceae sp. PMI_573]